MSHSATNSKRPTMIKNKKSLMLLLLVGNKLEPDLKKKANHFNIFFTSKCTFLINNRNLPGLLDFKVNGRFY